MTALITPQTVISYDTGEGGITMYPIHLDYKPASDRDRSLRAAEQYELQRALRAADELKRAERAHRRKSRTHRYLRLITGRVA